MKEMTVTEALRELSLYDEKIEKAIYNAEFIAIKRKSASEKNFCTAASR